MLLWAREDLVCPEQSGQFKEIDVVDVNKDNAGREWILPASSIQEQAIGRGKSRSVYRSRAG